MEKETEFKNFHNGNPGKINENSETPQGTNENDVYSNVITSRVILIDPYNKSAVSKKSNTKFEKRRTD